MISLHFITSILFLIGYQDLSNPRIATPNAETALESYTLRENLRQRHSSEISAGRMRAPAGGLRDGRPPSLSYDAKAPTRLLDQSILTREFLKKRYSENSVSARDTGFTTYLSAPDAPPIDGCAVVATHPAGVQRSSDGSLNGISSLIECNSYVMEVRVFDYRFPTSVTMSQSLPNGFVPIRGGNMIRSYGMDSLRRVRVGGAALGSAASVDITLYSDGPLDTERAGNILKDCAESLLSVYDIPTDR